MEAVELIESLKEILGDAKEPNQRRHGVTWGAPV
jgi:hypothetical protein